MKSFLSRILILCLRVYQRTISLDHGPLKVFYPNGYCKFYPSCSEYAVQAIQKKGAAKGVFHAFRRLARCHPWSEGGIDYVKE
jgi:putative membrane protein insertion efficiency factor